MGLSTMADEIDHKQHTTGWQRVIAWLPVYTIGCEWKWLRRVYRRQCCYDGLTVYEYATFLDLVKINEKRRARERFWQGRTL